MKLAIDLDKKSYPCVNDYRLKLFDMAPYIPAYDTNDYSKEFYDNVIFLEMLSISAYIRHIIADGDIIIDFKDIAIDMCGKINQICFAATNSRDLITESAANMYIDDLLAMGSNIIYTIRHKKGEEALNDLYSIISKIPTPRF